MSYYVIPQRTSNDYSSLGYPVNALAQLVPRSWNDSFYPVGDPRNNHGFFFNQNSPAVTWTTWGSLLAKRTSNPNQKFIVVVEGFYGGAQTAHGLSLTDMGGLAQNWGTWIKGRPEVVGSIVFLWPDLGSDPGSKTMMDMSPPVRSGQDSTWP